MKSTHPHAVRGYLQHVFDASTHLPGSFIGEGDGRDLMSRISAFIDQIVDLFGNDAGFAAAGTG